MPQDGRGGQIAFKFNIHSGGHFTKSLYETGHVTALHNTGVSLVCRHGRWHILTKDWILFNIYVCKINDSKYNNISKLEVKAGLNP